MSESDKTCLKCGRKLRIDNRSGRCAVGGERRKECQRLYAERTKATPRCKHNMVAPTCATCRDAGLGPNCALTTCEKQATAVCAECKDTYCTAHVSKHSHPPIDNDWRPVAPVSKMEPPSSPTFTAILRPALPGDGGYAGRPIAPGLPAHRYVWPPGSLPPAAELPGDYLAACVMEAARRVRDAQAIDSALEELSNARETDLGAAA